MVVAHIYQSQQFATLECTDLTDNCELLSVLNDLLASQLIPFLGDETWIFVNF